MSFLSGEQIVTLFLLIKESSFSGDVSASFVASFCFGELRRGDGQFWKLVIKLFCCHREYSLRFFFLKVVWKIKIATEIELNPTPELSALAWLRARPNQFNSFRTLKCGSLSLPFLLSRAGLQGHAQVLHICDNTWACWP